MNAYHWFWPQPEYDSLRRESYHFAAFQNNNGQLLPDYVVRDPDILIIDDQQR